MNAKPIKCKDKITCKVYVLFRYEDECITVPDSIKELTDVKIVSESGIWPINKFQSRFIPV
jgi:hypothetical protein